MKYKIHLDNEIKGQLKKAIPFCQWDLESFKIICHYHKT